MYASKTAVVLVSVSSLLAVVLTKQIYSNQHKHKKPKDIHKKPQQEGWLSPTKRASAAKIN